MERFVCIHGHFYQPPRENPWLEAIEIQDSAYPYHDWNERITAECYAPNSYSRILDDTSHIKHIVSNYARMSFNVGPTLLSWLEEHSPTTYAGIIESDRQSMQARSGHGAAMAQAYSHMIMPLADSRDKRTQIIWGIRDFKYRFGRDPEGMWLPETAVDLESLDIMAEFGIRFTVLAPHQAARYRPLEEEKWTELNNGNIDPSRPYRCTLPSGRSIAIFFYDGPISLAVAFEGLLKSGKNFADRLMKGFSENRNGAQLVHIATDGESYGHHHRYGDMALAYALDYIETHNLAHITNYGEYLENNLPDHEVEIHENSSWSCAHGIERWRSDCGCSTGAHPQWNQGWRAPLRSALDWLRDELSALFEKHAMEYFTDPWHARDHYIFLVLDRSDENVQRFLTEHCLTFPGEVQRIRALKLMELQRHAMLMYTSCGWFFDDISGIETVQILQYAGRAIQLARELFGVRLEEEYEYRLAAAHSNIQTQGTGCDIYTSHVKPREVDLSKVAAHYAISSIFEDYGDETDIYCYKVVTQNYRKEQSGKTGAVTGQLHIRSTITGEHDTLSFGLILLGEHDFNCGVKSSVPLEEYEEMAADVFETFHSGSFAELVRIIDRNFGTSHYTLQSLFTDEQRFILQTIIKETLDSFLSSYRQIFDDNRMLMGFLKETGLPVPKAFLTAAEYTLNHDLGELLLSDSELDSVSMTVDEFKRWNINPDAVDLEFAFRRHLERHMRKLAETPSDLEALQHMEHLIDVALALPFEINLWSLQNSYYRLAGTAYRDVLRREGHESPWAKSFRAVGKKLYFNLEAVLGDSGAQG
jgi:alpha-amylase/alpha-mannosidase (GH57 family)